MNMLSHLPENYRAVMILSRDLLKRDAERRLPAKTSWNICVRYSVTFYKGCVPPQHHVIPLITGGHFRLQTGISDDSITLR